ncbi:altronate dehydratase family protein [Treponema sp. J25]|uniref:UxaA family hydrolase n=1 Tax=Treponema sp. J25 TaxID=2094121 RepID=UPI00104A1ED0|nr:altronate dehydratase family protein [Treponema sp. J25]TCW62463.1 altronate hydrolase [Treponema sp. J25]
MGVRYRLLSSRDSVLVAVDPIPRGTVITIEDEKGMRQVTARDDIPRGHKMALRDILQGEEIIKYGYPIGRAKTAIPAGGWVHTHSCGTQLEGTLEYSYRPAEETMEAFVRRMVPLTKDLPRTFAGYRRSNGKVGVRNEIWIIPTVGCVNQIAELVAQRAREILAREGLLAEKEKTGSASVAGGASTGQIDGVFTFPHPYGCSQLGTDHETTRRILANLTLHPNAGGVLVLGLGCENNTVSEFKKLLGNFDERRIRFLVAQELQDEVEEALQVVLDLARQAAEDRREEVPVSELVVGLKCGGSDGFSGITANPLVGTFSDRLVALGGTTILTEVPEMFGAETILMQRARDREIFEKTVHLINDFKEYFIRHDQVVYENPSPGNKEGGITTLEDKSLGCVQKGGTAPVCGVYPYGGMVDTHGLVLLSGPGNDIVSVTALAAAGAHLVLFTTGRGTPLGGPVPTVKIASNTALAEKKPHWIDFDAGRLLDLPGREERINLENEFYRLVLEVASGRPTKNEINGYREIAILKDGVTL